MKTATARHSSEEMAQELFFADLFEHQLDATERGVAELEKFDRCKIVMACGTGKTRVGPALAILRKARSAIVYLPSLALVRQTLPEWVNVPFEGGVNYLCVCSDKTVTESDEAAVTREELASELGTERVTTNHEVVRSFLERDDYGLKVVFSTYQSSDLVHEACPDGFMFDIGLFDEAHRTAGCKSTFNGPLTDAHTPIAKRVFMTATPKHVSFRKRDKHGDGIVAYSMDDQAIYGREAYTLPLRDAINRGIIAGYRILVTVIDDSRLGKSVSHGSRLSKHINKEMLAHAVAIREATDQYAIRKVVTFHESVHKARCFAEDPVIQQELGARTFHVNGSVPTHQREVILDEFKASAAGVVTNAKCLTEGVDVPDIEMVAFLHPKKSHIDIIQAIGRALRLPRDSRKTTGYILLPLYVSKIEGGGLESALKEFGYDTIFRVIQALREQDQVVDCEIRDAIERHNRGEKTKPFSFVTFHGNDIHLDDLRKIITIKCIETLSASWDEWFAILQTLHAKGEDVNVQRKAVIGGKNIGQWVSNQRRSRNVGAMLPDRVARLESIGFEWSPTDKQFDENFRLLERLHGEGKDVNLQARAIFEGKKIGLWLGNLRQQYRMDNLSESRVVRLKSIGVRLDTEAIVRIPWDTMYDFLAGLHAEGKEINLPTESVINGKRIGQWIGVQRKSYKKGWISAERVARLEAIGLLWDPKDADWEWRYACLKHLHDQGDEVNVERNFKIDGKGIGQWLHIQRTMHYRGTLLADRVARLEAIGVVWNVRNATWDQHFALLLQMHEQGKDVNLANSVVVDGKRIGSWAENQREQYRYGKQTKERIERLESIGFVWDVTTKRWEDNFALLQNIYLAGGDANVKKHIEIDGRKIGLWLYKQRSDFKSGTLLSDRFIKLCDIGVRFENTQKR